MKNNIDYYRHEANSHEHPKFKALRAKYGWAGEGQFWALNNIIGQSDGCKLDLNKGYNRLSIATDLGMSPDDFDQYISFLAEACHLISIEEGVISTDIVSETYRVVNEEREKDRARKELRMQKKAIPAGKETIPAGKLKIPDGNNHQVKEEVKEEVKVKEEEVKPPLIPQGGQRSRITDFDFSFIDPDFKPLFMRWIDFRKQLKKNFKNQKMLEQNYSHLMKLSGGDLKQATLIVDYSISNQYQGLFEIKKTYAAGTQNRTNFAAIGDKKLIDGREPFR
ncbi:uncharacterized protein DUF4373 [Arcticibacter pallidicorallinus]|uniref:Uncharacterized protein DUF4373 n=1 Tax=Arcticibacter pallidicorallinus TaxID=1259464 RepID=A0A2T0U0S6_9SPHI|nr:Lin1244/Lin1753 domain-containing protein [Arcticibacter pallidicorallinus]PRY51502.1 uncharacterized protein DUF4373 [Arcticibacter pallidicorallinus]